MIRSWANLAFDLAAADNELVADLAAQGGMATARLAVECDIAWGGALVVACEYLLAPGGDWRELDASFTAEGATGPLDVEAIAAIRLRITTPHATAGTIGRAIITAARAQE